jgi:hypothetical protein
MPESPRRTDPEVSGRRSPISALLNGRANLSVVLDLHGEDGASSGEAVLVQNELGSTKIGRFADVLKDDRECSEQLEVRVRELVLARLGCLITEGLGQKGNVRSLVLGDLSRLTRDPTER